MKRTAYFSGVAALALAAVLGTAAAEARPGEGRWEFSTLDTDGNGEVTLAEIEAMRSAHFAEIDADGDGNVTRSEFEAHAQARAAERAGEMFDRLDADGDGLLGRDALEAGRPGPGPERMLARLDTDGNGAISEAEFDAGRERFAERAGSGRMGGHERFKR